MKKYILILLLFVSAFGYSQVGGFSMLNLDPKTTTERDNVSIAQGLINGSIVLNETTGTLDFYNGSTWVSLGGSGSTYTAGTGLTESPTGTFNVNETYLNGVYLPLDGSQSMEGNLDMGNNQVSNVNLLNATTITISDDVITANIQSETGSFSDKLRLPVLTQTQENQLSFVNNGYIWFNDDTKTFRKANSTNTGAIDFSSGGTDDQTAAEVTYDNTTSGLTATDVQGAIDELESLTGGSASLTGYHSMLELTANGTASYANQVTGSGYRVINEVKGTTDIDYIINNLRSSLVNENYSFVSNSSSSILELLEGSASFVGKGQEGNNAVRVADYGSANLLEISDGVFRVDGDFEWFTYAQNLILQGTQGSGTGNGATGGTHPGMTNSGTLPTYVIADDGSSAFDFNRYEVTIDLASNGLSVGDTIQITADSITGGTSPNIYVNINSTSNTQIATINASQLSDTGVIPSGATELSIWFLPNFNSTNNTTATFTNVRVTKL